jgi:hypothetical protein
VVDSKDLYQRWYPFSVNDISAKFSGVDCVNLSDRNVNIINYFCKSLGFLVVNNIHNFYECVKNMDGSIIGSFDIWRESICSHIPCGLGKFYYTISSNFFSGVLLKDGFGLRIQGFDAL